MAKGKITTDAWQAELDKFAQMHHTETHAEGMTAEEIAKKTGRSRVGTWQYLKRLLKDNKCQQGLGTRRDGRGRPYRVSVFQFQDNDLLKPLHDDEGYTLKEIAAKMGRGITVAQAWVTALLQQEKCVQGVGIRYNAAGHRHRDRVYRLGPGVEIVPFSLCEGYTLKELGERIGRGKTATQVWVNKLISKGRCVKGTGRRRRRNGARVYVPVYRLKEGEA